VYVASLHAVNEQKVRLLPEVVKPSTAVYVECDLSCQESYMCGSCTAVVNVPYTVTQAVGAIQFSVINLTQFNNKRSRCASVK